MKTNDYYDLLSTTPIIPDSVYEVLPPFLKELTNHFEDRRERDVVLISCLAILSGCFTGIKDMYGKKWISPNLYVFVVAPPANMKGSMIYSRNLGVPTQENFEKANFIARAEYETDYRIWKSTSKKKTEDAGDPPQKPKYPILFVPGNSSAAAIYSLLNESDGKVIICETEADSLTGAIKQDWGNFSYLLRSAFHHEEASMSRKGDNLYLRIPHPQVSVVLTGTPDQVPRLIGSSEDGLCSRFLFYCYNQGLNWIDQTPCLNCIDYSAHFSKLGYEVARIKKQLDKNNCTFSLTSDQYKTLNENFRKKLSQIKIFEGHGAGSAVMRLGLISFRIAMILTVLRLKDELKDKTNLECSDEDFKTAMALADVYFEHSMVMYSLLPKQSKAELSPKMRQFFTKLPGNEKFPRKKANEIGTEIGISERTVGSYLEKLVEKKFLKNPEYGYYQKPADE
jgi:Protein of unknown function (DUF3987)